MSPQSALHDPVYRAYVSMVFGSLLAGGVVLAAIQYGLRKDLGPIWKTYRSWLVMAPLALIVVFAGRVAVIVAVAVLSILALREFARASGLIRDRWLIAILYSGVVALAAASLEERVVAASGSSFALFTTAAACVVALILLTPVIHNRARGQLARISLGLVAFVYLGWMFGHLGLLANDSNAFGFICFIVFATEISDIAAFTFGRLFGRHALRSEISPNKTWEGALGALGVAMILPWLLRFSFPFFDTTRLILAGLIVGIGGQLGDLSISVIKRDLGAKDMGSAIPGHGGILDRIDSLIYVAPLFMHMVTHAHVSR
jgi:phosphatidate cytidylyltransferase